MILVYKTEKNRWLITHREKNYIEFGGLSLLRLFHHLIQKDRAAWLVKLMEGSIRCSANYIPLSPISFLERSAIVYRDRPSVVYGSIIYTWRETLERCTRLASALSQLGISRGDVVCNKLLISCYCKSLLCLFPLLTTLQFASSFFMVSVVWFVYLLFCVSFGGCLDLSHVPISNQHSEGEEVGCDYLSPVVLLAFRFWWCFCVVTTMFRPLWTHL